MNLVILILGVLTAFGPLSIDMYLPALPQIAHDFGAPLNTVQLSLASFFIGIATGQIFYGPITDKFGRKKPLYVGLTLYLMASIFCASGNSVESLIAFRFLQALGSCAGMVISRAMVRDLYPPHESAKVFSLLMLIMGVAPILAPVAGGVLSASLGWRAIFWVLAGISFITLLSVIFFLRETHEPKEEVLLRRTFHKYYEILQDKTFTGYTLSLSFIYAGMFAYITDSSFVFIEHYGLTPNQYAWVFGTNAFGLIFFSQVNGKLLRKRNPAELLNFIIPISALAGVVVLLQGLVNGPLWSMCLSLFLFILTLGMIAPNGSACALTNQKSNAGSASALLGTFQFTISAIFSSLVSHLHDGTIRPMCFVICLCGALSWLCYWFLVKIQLKKNMAI